MNYSDNHTALNAFSMIVVNNNRSKAYLQELLAAGFRPNSAIYIETKGQKLAEQTVHDSSVYLNKKQKFMSY